MHSPSPVLKTFVVNFYDHTKRGRELRVRAHTAMEDGDRQVWFLVDDIVTGRFQQVIAWWEEPSE